MEPKQKKLFRNAVLGTALALGIGAAACGGRPGVCPNDSPVCFPVSQDAGTPRRDSGFHNDAAQIDALGPPRDSGFDAARFDALPPKQDSGTDSGQTDGGLQPPKYSHTVDNLLYDYLDRLLFDRGKGPREYPLSTPLSDPNANPFADGAGGTVGPACTAMYRVDGTMFVPFAATTVTDIGTGKSFVERQDLWIIGDNHFSVAAADVVGHLDFVSYTLRFNGESDGFGIPVGNGGLHVNFLGGDWTLSALQPPTATLSNTDMVVPGGSAVLTASSTGRSLSLQSGENVSWGSEPYCNDPLVFLTWQNDGTSSTGHPNRLKSIIIEWEGIGYDMNAGDEFLLAQSEGGFKLAYNGLSDTPGIYSTLEFHLERNPEPYVIPPVYGPVDASGLAVGCTIAAPYVKVVSSVTSPVFTVVGVQGAPGTDSASNNEFYVATSGATCGGSIGTLPQGSLFMRVSLSSLQWSYLDYSATSSSAVMVKYPLVGDGVSDGTMGVIVYQYSKDFMPPGAGDFEFAILQETGVGVSQHSPAASWLGLVLNGAQSTFDYDFPGLHKKGNMVYDAAGPVLSVGGDPVQANFEPTGFVDERGTRFMEVTDTLVEYKVAGTLVYSQFVLTTTPTQ